MAGALGRGLLLAIMLAALTLALGQTVSQPSDADIATYHILLWSGVALLITTCCASCSLAYMDTGDNTILDVDTGGGGHSRSD